MFSVTSDRRSYVLKLVFQLNFANGLRLRKELLIRRMKVFTIDNTTDTLRLHAGLLNFHRVVRLHFVHQVHCGGEGGLPNAQMHL